MKQRPPAPPPALLRDAGHCIALGFGSGLSPRAPGTAGTLVGVALYLLLSAAGPIVYALGTLAVAALGIALAGRTARALGVADHPAIVIDEVAGFLVTMWWIPPGLLSVAAGFVLFRLLDILKPWPISVADRRLHGGLGIMLDDLLAGLLACGLLHGLLALGLG